MGQLMPEFERITVSASEVKEIIEIHPDCKYVVVLKSFVPMEALELLKDRLNEFWNDPEQKFVILYGGDIELVKVSDVKD